MTRDPFLRLALIAACVAGTIGLLYMGDRLGGWIVGVGFVIGVVFALAIAEDWQRPPTRDQLKEQLRPSRRRVEPDGTPRDFERV
jgi:hypothetical protein